MRSETALVRLACLGGLLLAAPGVVLAQGVAMGEAMCSACHRPSSGPGAPGCPQATTLHSGGGGGGGYGGYGGYGGSGDEALRAAARDLGSALGQALANELFGDPQREAREAAFRHQQALAEQARREAEAAARRLRAEQLREEWDERDLEHARGVASIFAAPRRRRPQRPATTTGPVVEEEVVVPALEPWTYMDTSVVDLGGTPAGMTGLPRFEEYGRGNALYGDGFKRHLDTTAFNRTLATYGVVPAIAGDSRGAGGLLARPRELARDFAVAVGRDLADELGSLVPGPYEYAKRTLLIIDDATLPVDYMTASGRVGSESDLDLTLDDRRRVAALGHASDDDSIVVADALARDPSAASALVRERVEDAAKSRARRRVVLGE